MPGCIFAGDTIDEAILRNATEALADHIRFLEAEGDEVPGPWDFDSIMADRSLAVERAGAIATVVPLVRDRESSVRVNVSFDLGLLDSIGAAARAWTRT